MRHLKKNFPPLAFLLLIWACYQPKEYTFRNVDDFKGWKIYPSSTVVGQRKDFVISGKNLFTAEVIAGPSVKVEILKPAADGKTLKVYLTVDTLDATDPLDKPGKRIIQVKTPDTLQVLSIQVLNDPS